MFITSKHMVAAEPRLAEFFSLDFKTLPEDLQKQANGLFWEMYNSCTFCGVADSSTQSCVAPYVQRAQELVTLIKTEAQLGLTDDGLSH
jgi:hypothetical protein